jgi:hypothetical protein
MANSKSFGIGCLVLAALFAAAAINTTFISPQVPVGDASGLGVSRMVGAFLPSIVLLAVAVWLLKKPR